MSNRWISITIVALDDALNLACYPTTVEISRLGIDLLAIDEAIPRTSIERKMVLERLKSTCRRLVGPDAVQHLVFPVWARDGIIRRSTFPLAP